MSNCSVLLMFSCINSYTLYLQAQSFNLNTQKNMQFTHYIDISWGFRNNTEKNIRDEMD